jgi:aryl-alcohol dehydrogenase-like predicted oxidoreductase
VKKPEAARRNPRAGAPPGDAVWHTRGVRSLRRPLGSTGLNVAPLGLGGGPLGDLGLADADAARVIDAALDAGVDLIDTAPSYGASEDRLGRALRGRRDQVVLVTKGGYGVPGVPDWSPR